MAEGMDGVSRHPMWTVENDESKVHVVVLPMDSSFPDSFGKDLQTGVSYNGKGLPYGKVTRVPVVKTNNGSQGNLDRQISKGFADCQDAPQTGSWLLGQEIPVPWDSGAKP